MRRALPWLLLAVFGSCSHSGGGDGEPLPSLPDGLLRDPGEWIFLPRIGRDPECAPGTPCARALDSVFAWAGRWADPAIVPDFTESLSNNNDHDVVALACALAWRASDDPEWRLRARLLIEQVVATPYPVGGSALRPGRNLLSYVLAASTIELAELDPLLELGFRAWIERVAELDRWSGDGVSAGTFRDYQEQRPNNVGLVVGAARIAVDAYLGGERHARHLLAAQRVFRGFLGDDGAYEFPRGAFGGGVNDNSWQSESDPDEHEGVAPLGARIPHGTGLDVDGCLPEEMRRLGALDCLSCGVVPSLLCYNAADTRDGGVPPGFSATGYPWEALQGLVMQAYLLSRTGFDAFGWEDAAVERAHRFLFVTYGLRPQDTWNDATQSDDPACCDGVSERGEVDDTWVPHILEALRDPGFLDESNLVYGGRPGKNCGFADWWTLGLGE
jgi:hypothetical protein